MTLRFLDDFNIPTGAPLENIESAAGFGGLSGIGYDPKTGTLMAVSDGRSYCRFYRLEPRIQDENFEVRPMGVTPLLDLDGEWVADGSMNPESLAIADNGDIFITSEGIAGAGALPGLYLFDAVGRFKKNLPVPEKFLPGGEGKEKGPRDNLAFESLTLSPDGKRLFLGIEQALLQDGDETTPEAGGAVRILEYVIEGDEIHPIREIVYPIEPVGKPEEFGPGVGGNGLVDLLALDHHHFLTLERSFFVESSDSTVPRTHQQIRIFKMSLEQATDVSNLISLRGTTDFRFAQKELVLDLEDIVPDLDPEFPTLDNFEGMCFGPELPNGNRTLILVSDNNFNESQRTAFFLFEVIEK
jgi:hypothetical protein